MLSRNTIVNVFINADNMHYALMQIHALYNYSILSTHSAYGNKMVVQYVSNNVSFSSLLLWIISYKEKTLTVTSSTEFLLFLLILEITFRISPGPLRDYINVS